MILVYITILFLILYSFLIIYYARAWNEMQEFKLNSGFTPSTKISVIIPARNEENNIGACLHSLLQQDYPENLFEVIVADDFSEDGTAEVVRNFRVPNVKLISLQNEIGNSTDLNSYKKRAIEIGIQHATGNLIVCTDADCIAERNWLKTIAGFYEQQKPVFIASPVSFYNDNRLLPIFQSLDFISLQGITGASVYKKAHTMCNGANLAYEHKVFDEVEGFRNIDHIASGDDMLLMHKIYQRYPDQVKYLKASSAIVRTKPAASLSEFFSQRIRWASKASQYDDKRIFWVLLLVYLLNLSLFVLFITSLFKILLWKWLGAIIAVKFLIELSLMIPVSRFFGKTKLLWFFLPAQPFHILYTVVAGFFGQFGTYNWKGRRVK